MSVTKTVVALVGSFGSGCGTAARYLNKKHGFAEFSLGTIVREHAKREYAVDNPRRNQLQDIGDTLRRNNAQNARRPHVAYGYLARRIISQMNEHSASLAPACDFVVRGVRHPDEITVLRKRHPHNFILVNIDAPADQRWERVRREEGYITRGEFSQNDRRDSGEDEPDWGQHVQQCCDEADIVIVNAGSRDDLHRKLDYYVDLLQSPRQRSPSRFELAMKHAYTARARSTCACRMVGAAILRGDNVVATGHNGKRLMANSCKALNKCPRRVMSNCCSCGSPIQFTMERCSQCRHTIDPDDFKALSKKLDFCVGVHAEERAILNVRGDRPSSRSVTLFSTTFPCLLCAKVIVEAGIRKLVYSEPYPYRSSYNFLKQSNVKIFRFEGVTAHSFGNSLAP